MRLLVYCVESECDDLPQSGILEGFTEAVEAYGVKWGLDADSTELRRAFTELQKRGLKVDPNLVMLRPGKLPDDSIASFYATLRRNLLWWSLYIGAIVALHLVLRLPFLSHGPDQPWLP